MCTDRSPVLAVRVLVLALLIALGALGTVLPAASAAPSMVVNAGPSAVPNAGPSGPPVGAATRAAGPADPTAPEMSAWLPHWSITPGLTGFSTGRAPLTTVSPFWFDVTSCSRIASQTSSTAAAEAVRRLRLRGVAVVPTLTASGLDPARAIACLGTPATREAHVRRILDLVRTGRYDGIDLDYEHLALTTNPATARRVRSALTSFVRSLCPRLTAQGKQCIATVMARTGGVAAGSQAGSDSGSNSGSKSDSNSGSESEDVWQGALSLGAYDYAALGEAATRVRIMAYDQHTRRSPAGPIASYPWVQGVARYAASQIPVAKLTLGIPAYGRDWSGGTARTLTRDQAMTLARRLGVTPRWDRTAKEYTFAYRVRGVRHTVWFPGTRGILERDRLARSLGLGSAVWAAGLEPSDMWRTLRADRFTTR